MAELRDEEFEKAVDDKLDASAIEAWDRNEEVWGVIQCQQCNYWGKMEGICEASDKRWIKFVCPKCSSLERVRNPEYLS